MRPCKGPDTGQHLSVSGTAIRLLGFSAVIMEGDEGKVMESPVPDRTDLNLE